MARSIDGVRLIKKNDYALCHIDNFSEEFKTIIKERLSSICNGASNGNSKRKMYSYQATIKEFLKRYDLKPPNTKKGLIGELLTHILLTEMFDEYSIVSPYFNSEERSIKKGFDIVLTSLKSNDLWITEVKSGELHKGKSSDETMSDLLGLAQTDLITRLNDENTSLWRNAINGAKIAMDSYNDLKEAIVDILEDLGDKSIDGTVNSKDINVFLTGVLFSDLSNCITEKNTKSKVSNISTKGVFKSVFILSVQKETYQKVYDFLKKEGE